MLNNSPVVVGFAMSIAQIQILKGTSDKLKGKFFSSVLSFKLVDNEANDPVWLSFLLNTEGNKYDKSPIRIHSFRIL